MTTGERFLVVLALASLGLWGCAQGPANGPVSAEKLRALENKVAKLEGDIRGTSASRDQLRKQVAALEEEKSQLTQQVEQLQLVVKERDSLKKQLTVRTSERDNIQNQFEHFRKGIKTLLGQAELSSAPALSVADAAPQGKS
jgi:septal ring factor EnvC (AmiA/AmiB activator)